MTSTPVSRRTALGTAAALSIAGAAGAAGPALASPAQASAGEALIGAAGQMDLHVMSFNIRLDLSGTLPGQADHWPERIRALQAVLGLERPTILGVQEALYHQLATVEEALPQHFRSVGYGRDGGSAGEHSAIFYDSRRLDVLEWDQFWLSDTPATIGSATWGNTVTRVAVWARFRDLSTGRELLAVNTHFDHESENARILSAQAIADLLAGFTLPTVVTGDFNAPAETPGAYEALVGSGLLRDTWTAAERRLTPAWGTFANYKDPVEGASRIDWVLATSGMTVHQAAINPFTLEDRYPSDHLPVQALVRIP
ncbi:endonuclease/exonuclease/phosphatase family protein [Sinomonas mesophila]|uniref:endonuclease/exonuclease/phosphatase family protein n=1 Tax=Sinomonas mesophila TaxID=1531955 RepID=UPI001FE512D4|nr:endonuclease/exonuclease/phosphatase family protein [Sinomonas mesophila]